MDHRHGGDDPRPGARDGRFGRMFPCLAPADTDPGALDELVGALEARKDSSLENDRVSAGYTYLGQFVDHDITFDATSRLDRGNDPAALPNFRTPRLDLDSLYGSGPADQPYLYDWRGEHRGIRLLVGRNPPDEGFAPADLPRNDRGRALTGDPRNDENLIVAQLQLLFIRFHNKVVEDVLARSPRPAAEEAFEEARRIVRWHYQWIVAHDFLPKVVDEDVVAAVLARASPVTEIPIEFSGAVYRFGHSMVRNDYILNDRNLDVPTFPVDAAAPGRHLGGFRRLPEELVIEWPRMFGSSAPRMRSMRIDTSLAGALFRLPQGDGAPLDSPQLAALNLRRGLRLGLPAGDAVAAAMGATPLAGDDLFPRELALSDAALEELLRAPPLWYYVLREAELVQGRPRLGPVAGRIVAEVLVGLLAADPDSYLRRDPPWEPELPRGDDGAFTMLDLVNYALR